MTANTLEINNDSYLHEHLTFDPETKVFSILTERVGDWKKINFKYPKKSAHDSYIKSLYFNPSPENIKRINQIFEEKKMRNS